MNGPRRGVSSTFTPFLILSSLKGLHASGLARTAIWRRRDVIVKRLTSTLTLAGLIVVITTAIATWTLGATTALAALTLNLILEAINRRLKAALVG